jgi:succinate-semialdehyde dehydrogenase/glutarate-semialdehyde dehydrogenase
MVLEDADLDKAAAVGAQARFLNGGQSCIAAKRFLVMKSVYEEFLRKFIGEMQKLVVGDPMDEKTDVGPPARCEFIEELEGQLTDARQKGAEIIDGPSAPEGPGCFFNPVAVTRVTSDMRIFREEVFGPIAPIMPVESEEEMLRLANDTEFGLGASIWTRNIQRGETLARKIQAGFIAINDMVKSDPRLPFGGIKMSGVGRELSSLGMKEFSNIRTVVVRAS